MLDEEQIKKIKEQIISQIDTWHASEEQKEQAKKQIQDMSSEKLEEFLIKNKLIKSQEENNPQQKQECPFCLILQNKLNSYKIEENKENLAILEINPLSQGHTLVISKQHDKLPSSAFSLATKIAKKLKSKLRAEEVKIENVSILGHQIINIVPVYKDKRLERKKATEQELKEMQEKLITKAKEKIVKEKSTKPKQLEKAPVRIP